MLDPWIIEEIRRREEERRRNEQRPALEIQTPEMPSEGGLDREERPDEDRGVVIVDFRV